jgi:antitoxin VapB
MTSNPEIVEKTERLVRLIEAEKLAGVLINAQHNFAWLTCGGANGIDISRDPGAGWLLVRRDGKRFVLANRIEMARLIDEELAGGDFEAVEFPWEDERAAPDFVVKRARALLEGNQAVGCDLPVTGADRIVEAQLSRVRSHLTQPEIERYRELGRDAGEVIGRLARRLEPGMSEREIARLAVHALAGKGMRAVVALVAADERLARYRHPVPTERRWERVAMIVVCARRGGLIASLTRIVCSGAVPDELLRRTNACARVNARLWEATRAGVSGSELYSVAAHAYEDEGFSGEERLHHQGGATGYRTREWVAHPYCDEKVQIPQAFAWNPSITGTKVEETCLAFDDWVESISASPDWPKIQVKGGERDYEFPDVLAL